MRLTSTGLIAFAATIAATTIARSADLPVKAPAPPVTVPYNWTGSYIGGNIGYGWGRDAIDLTSSGIAVPVSLADNPRGVVGGIQYGTNWQFNRFVLGWDSDFVFTGIKASETVFTVPGGIATGTSAEQKLEWLSTTRGRLGYLITDNLLLFGTGGLASGRVSANTIITQVGCPIGGCLAGSDSRTQWGWAAGGGLEYAIGHWLVRAEYLHYDLGDLNYNVVDPRTAALVAATNKVSGDIVRGALSYKFDWTFWDLLFGRR
ncbi:MAG TPA: outer membrane beta-barrel protein [Pseudolabrys sp.]|nr:outer membrane beta-barrel protein [Pseudolabrys sp.]